MKETFHSEDDKSLVPISFWGSILKYFTLVLFTLMVCSFNLLTQLSGTKIILGDEQTQGVGSGRVIFKVTADYSETIASTTLHNTTKTILKPLVIPIRGCGVNFLITAFTGGIGSPSLAVQSDIWSKIEQGNRKLIKINAVNNNNII